MTITTTQTIAGNDTGLHTEVLGDLTVAECEEMAAQLKKSGQPKSAPAGKWRLVSVKAFPSQFPPGMTIPELERAGKLRIIGKRWHRLFRLVCRWELIESVRGIAGQNKARTHCPAGHPYDASNTIRTKQGFRRCRQCAKAAVKASKAKAKAKKLAGTFPPSAPKPLNDYQLLEKVSKGTK